MDLYVIDPCGNQICFQNKTQKYNDKIGLLDVDANVSKYNIAKNPQENIVWEKGGSKGSYKVLINDAQNRTEEATEYVLTIINNGEISQYKGNIEVSGFKEIISFLH